MIITDPSTICFNDYKRFFAFGCSFTQYRWPTWADIIAKDNPDLEYYNIGKSGAGNTFILNQISHYSKKMQFDQNDLVMVLWSSFYREDRYTYERSWKTPGNIYTQNEYSEEFVNTLCCPRGMTIRDLTLIDTASHWFELSDFTVCQGLAVPYDMQNSYSGQPSELEEEFKLSEVYDLYRELPDKMHTSLIDCFPNGWTMEYKAKNEHGESFNDYHPTVMGYLEYLGALGIEISKPTQTWVFGEHQRLLLCDDTGKIGNIDPQVIL